MDMNVTTRLTPLQERAIHALVQETLSHPFYTRIQTPEFSSEYDTSNPRTLGDLHDVIQDELSILTGELELKGIVLFDYNLFEQENGKVVLVNFKRCFLLGEWPSIV